MKQKLKIKKLSKFGILFLAFSFALWNCQYDDKDKELIEIEKESLFRTTSIEKAQEFLNSIQSNSLARGTSSLQIEADFSKATQEELINSTEKIIVVPAKTIFKNAETKIIFTESNQGQVVPLLFNITHDANSTKNSHYGFVTVTSINGDFVDAYRIRDNIAVSKLKISDSRSLSGTSSRNFGISLASILGTDCDENLNTSSIFCDNTLDEVVISSGSSNNTSSNAPSGFHIPCTNGSMAYCGIQWRYNNNSYYSYGQAYYEHINQLQSQPCPAGQERDSNGQCVDRNPCNEVKSLVENSAYMSKIDELKGMTSQTKENGFIENIDGSFRRLPVTNNGHSLDIKTNGNSIGFMHTHINDHDIGINADGNPIRNNVIRMFSPRDVITLLSIAKRHIGTNVSVSRFYGTMVSSSGTYTIKFMGDPTQIPNNYNEAGLKTEYLKLTKRYGRERGFLKFLDEKLGVEGVKLYKIKNNGRIKKKTLNDRGRLNTDDCE